MKFRKSFAFLCFATLSLGLIGCGASWDGTFTVTFDTQGGSEIAPVKVKSGETLTKPENPVKEDYEFVAWYEDKEAVTEFDFSLEITANWTLYAGWKLSSDPGPGPGPGPGPEPEETYIYFRDASWWNTAAAATYVSIDGGEKEEMEYVGYNSVGQYNDWKIEIEDNTSTIQFFRCSGSGEYWGATTVEISLSERGDNDMYDITATTSAWTDQGNYVTGTWAKYDNPTYDGGGTDPTDDEFVLYFRDASWWNNAAAATYIKVDNGNQEKMTHLQWVEAESYNYWSYNIAKTASKVTFFRCSGSGEDWGAATVEVLLSERGTHNMYDISMTSAAWKDGGNYVTGQWADYTA